MKRYLVYLGPFVLYYALVSYLSSREELPSVFPTLFFGAGSDKVMHALEYALAGFLVARAYAHLWIPQRWGTLVAVSAFTVLVLGALDEYHQSFVPGRDANLFDLYADVVGGAVGAVVYALGRYHPGKAGAG